MKNIIDLIKVNFAMLFTSFSNAEKNILTQTGADEVDDLHNIVSRHTKGHLADSLQHGELTEEVKQLRWRTYQILRNSDGLTAEITGYDEDGFPIVKTKKRGRKNGLKNIKLDNVDDYPLEMVMYNDPTQLDSTTIMDSKYINDSNEISAEQHFATINPERPIYVSRKIVPKFNIESYTTKLNVRSKGRKKKLLEFYISMYPNENKKSRLLLSEINKAIKDPSKSSLLEIDEVNFITYKTVGSEDFLEYVYKIDSFDKIITFDGHYVIKFNATVKVNGEDIFDKFRNAELEEKYKNKEKK